MQAKLDGSDAPKAAVEPMSDEQVLKIDKLADDINGEIGEITFGVKADYDWDILDLILDAQKQVNNFLDLQLAATEDTNARLAMRKLRTRMYTASGVIKKSLGKLKADLGQPSVSEAYLKKLRETEDELAKVKKVALSITPEEVLQLDALADTINGEVATLTFGVDDTYNFKI